MTGQFCRMCSGSFTPVQWQWPVLSLKMMDCCHLARSLRLVSSSAVFHCWFRNCWNLPLKRVFASAEEIIISYRTDEGSKPEILSRTARTTTALTRLKPVWNDRSISLSSKIRLMRSLVTSTFLYAFESWTLTAELQRRIQAMEMRCYRKILCISYKDHVTYEDIRAKIQQAI